MKNRTRCLAAGLSAALICCDLYGHPNHGHSHFEGADQNHSEHNKSAHLHPSLINESMETEGHLLNLPGDLPETFSVKVPYDNQQLTLQLEKNSVFGKNTRFLVSDESGSLKEADLQVDRSYLGRVAEYPNLMVSAVLSESGLFANVIRHGQDSIRIEPREVDGQLLHYVSAPITGDYQASQLHDDPAGDVPSFESIDGSQVEMSQSTGAILTMFSTAVTSAVASGSTATLPPSRVMSVYEFEVGVEIGSAALLNNYSGSTVAQKTAAAMAVAQGIPGNLDARYLRASGVKYRLGTVIIRTSASEDKFTVNNGNDTAGLSAFRNYWNANPQEVGSTHDLAVYHVRSAPSGLAYVNTIGGNSRYALTASNGPTSWADGTLAHEFGHTWNLRHTNSAPIVNYDYSSNQDPPSKFYETKPRGNGGAAGGSHVFITPMNGNGNHNIGRFSTDEANEIYNIRNGKLSFGDLVSNPPQVGPFGHRDFAIASGGPITIDVIANDFDCNNDVLDVELRDTVSQKGATIALSQGTGPGGRCELIYTPPSGLNGIDFFHYNVRDTTGRGDWGVVYVSNRGPSTVDLSLTKYFYDLGTPSSPLFNGNSDPYQRLTNETFGDLGFTSNGPNPVEVRDRGNVSGTNAINRDHIRMRSPGAFKHKLALGIYDILFTVGDATENTNAIRFTAEGGAATLTTASHVPTTFTNYTLQDVTVSDGELNIDIENLGFSSNITRIIITRVGVPQSSLPGTDVGSTTPAGSTIDNGNGSFTLQGSGADIWGSADAFQFASNAVTGVNGTLAVRVDSVSNTNVWAKAGVHYRDSDAAGAKNVGIYCRPDGQVAMQWRATTNAASSWHGTLVGGTGFPKWVRLTKSGDAYTGAWSTNGTSWNDIRTVTVNMGNDNLGGLALTSHNNGTLATAEFSNFTSEWNNNAAPAVVTPPTGLTQLEFRHSSKCVDNKGGTTNQTEYHQWSCGTHPNRNFSFIDLGGGYYQVQSERSSRCLDVASGNTIDGGTLHQWDCSASNINQSWKLEDRGGGWFQLISRHSEKCVDVENSSTANQAKIFQKNCDSSKESQQLRFR